MRDRHILYVISRYTYRSTFIVREIAELAARGWSITVVSLRRPSFAPGSDPDDLPYKVTYDAFPRARMFCSLRSWPSRRTLGPSFSTCG